MSEKLPGAEYAPIIAIDLLRNEQRLADADEVAKLGSDAILLIGGLNQRVIRRLSCVDPDDQRAIWRLASLTHIGITTDQALQSVLAPMPGGMVLSDGRVGWSLRWGRSNRSGRSLWLETSTVEYATAALCAHVWGPK